MKEREQYIRGMIARMLAERVVEKLLERQKQALVVYTGSNMGIEAGLKCLRTLRREEGFTYRVLLTRSAAGMLDAAAICEALEPVEMWTETPGDSPEALTARYDTILVPALTVNTAAHVAGCMADTPAAAIILDGLMRGKNVVAAVDGCCPDNPERIRRGFHMTEALKKKLRENKDALRAFGAVLTTSDRLGEAALKAVTSFVAKPAFGKTKGQDSGEVNRRTEAKTAAGIFRASMEGRVFSGKHVRVYPDHSTILVPPRTIITQLASDEARGRDIRIEIEA